MAKQILNLKDFQAGIGTLGQKRDKPGSGRIVRNLNPFEDYDYITLSKKTAKISASVVDDVLLFMDDGNPFDNNRYALDQNTAIYEIDSSNTVTKLRELSSGGSVKWGTSLIVFDDFLYYVYSETGTSGGGNIGRYGPLSGTPAFDDDLTSWWDAALPDDLQTSGGGTGATDYTPPTSISETATNRQTFTATHDPLKKITIDVDVVGTGDWTITVHDSENNLVGTSTITNGSMSTGDVTFTFIDSDGVSPRITIGNDYHFHVTSTVADGGVDTDVNTDLEGAEFVIEYGILIRPPIAFQFNTTAILEDLLVIGNERYLATYNQAVFDPNTIAFDPGFRVQTVTKTEEYVVAECYKPNKTSSKDTYAKGKEGRRYYWDGIAPSFNFSEPIPYGIPNASTAITPDRFVGIYGTRGSLYDAKTGNHLTHEAPKITPGEHLFTYPGAIDHFQEKVVVGITSSKTDENSVVPMGVYEYGSQSSPDTPLGFNLSYIISTGNYESSVTITMVRAIGDDLYIGWADDATTGLDLVSTDSDAATSGVYESLIFDGGDPSHDKLAVMLRAKFVALASGESVTLAYDINRSGTFTADSAVSTSGETKAEFPIYKRFKEIEFKFTLASSGGTFPKLVELEFDYDDLADEGQNRNA